MPVGEKGPNCPAPGGKTCAACEWAGTRYFCTGLERLL